MKMRRWIQFFFLSKVKYSVTFTSAAFLVVFHKGCNKVFSWQNHICRPTTEPKAKKKEEFGTVQIWNTEIVIAPLFVLVLQSLVWVFDLLKWSFFNVLGWGLSRKHSSFIGMKKTKRKKLFKQSLVVRNACKECEIRAKQHLFSQ